MFKTIAHVYRHELKDFLRDRNTLRTTLILLVSMPIFFTVLVGNVHSFVQDERDKDKRLGYIESPAVLAVLPFLQHQGVIAVAVKSVDKKAFVDEKIDALLSERKRDDLDSPDEFGLRLDLWTNSTNQKAISSARQIENLIQSYGKILSRNHLVMNGVAPQLMDSISVDTKTIDDDQSESFATLDLLVSLFGMAVFYSTLHLAVDTTSGERERLTLESLLYTAAPRAGLVLGKWLLVTSVVFVGVWIVGTIYWALGAVPILQALTNQTVTFSYNKIMMGLMLFAPLCPMIAALQIMIGSLCTSVKQAQAFNGVSGLLSLPLSFLLLLEQIKPLNWVPIFGQGLAYRKYLHGEDIDGVALLAAEASTVLLAAIMLAFVLHRFHQEKIILTAT